MRRATAPLFAGGPDPLLATVLGRIVSMLAARSHFSLDRLSDAQLVSDALAVHAPDHTINGVVRIVVADPGDRALALRVGPLRPDGARALVSSSELPGVGLLLEALVDNVEVEPAEEGEHLHLSLSEPPA